MGKIYKAHQVKIDLEKPVFVHHHQKIPDPAEELDFAEEDFAEAVFKELSPEHLAGSGEMLTSGEKKVAEEGAEPQDSQDESSPAAHGQAPKAPESPFRPPRPSMLSAAAKKSRHMAALEAIKFRELELEALEEELREWETTLREKETRFTAEESKFNQSMLQKRSSLEAESKSIVQTANENAQSIVENARKEADLIKKTAQVEVDDIKDKAYKEGFRLGEEKGISAGEEQGVHEAQLDWQSLMQESETLINELQMSRMAVLKSSEEEMLKLVIAFAKAVLKVEPIIHPEIVLNNLDRAIDKVAEVDKIVMRINLKDKSMCHAHKERFMSRMAAVSELQIIEDSSLAPGGIKIETGVGTIDATIESQAAELEKALLERFRKSQS